MKTLFNLLLPVALALTPALVLAAPCELPDNGTGTIDLPPACPDGYLGAMRISDGLPPGTTLEIEARWLGFTGLNAVPGGVLGGEIQQFDAALQWHLTGTGDLAGFERTLTLFPQCEVHTGPRNPGDPVQTFGNELVMMAAQNFGDPDFCVLELEAGLNFGLPSPGQTVLTQLPGGDFNVDSFFDITYRIDFQGCPGSLLDGLAGSTTGTDRFQMGGPPALGGCILPEGGNGGVDLPPACPDGYLGDMAISEGLPAGTTLNLAATLTDFQNIQRSGDDACVLPDNGAGTLDLPPACPDGYLGHMSIMDGLPPGTSLEAGAALRDFQNVSRTLPVTCPLPDNGLGTADLPPACPEGYLGHLNILDGLPPGSTLEMQAVLTDFTAINRIPTGIQGGEIEEFSATLECLVSGTGEFTGYHRSLYVPVEGAMFHGPRYPGDPVQIIPAILDQLHGELFGDPDFCTLRISAGNAFGLPSPGQTTLTQLPSGDFAVDSFFDVTYRIEFEGCPGSPLEGLMGITTDADHFHAGEPFAGLGEIQTFTASLVWQVGGTGLLSGYNRTLYVPVSAEVHTGPRNPGDPVQAFTTELYSLQGELFGDPDFCTLRVLAGEGQGLPSPGLTTLTQLPDGDFAVDSFFDITFQIDFEGCPGSPLEGFLGTTTDTRHFQMGAPFSGGEIQEFDATLLWGVTGTGDLAGYLRTLYVPVHCVTRAANYPPPDPGTLFDFDLVSLQGELFGDPDFCTLQVLAGEDHSLPSPGQTALTQLPGGDFAVDSFFDVTFEIDFEGCPGSPLEGLGGTTTGEARLQAGISGLSGMPDRPGEVPRPGYVLHANTPNPFNPSTVIRFEVPATGGRVTLEIFDLRGRLVRTLVDGPQTPGLQQVVWDGADGNGRRAASGVYFYALTTAEGVLTRKMAVIK